MKALGAPKQKLHIFGRQFFQRLAFVFVDRAPDQVGLLLLELDNPRLDGILDAEPGDHTRPLLTDTMAAIGTLPFGCRVPPPAQIPSEPRGRVARRGGWKGELTGPQ